MIYFDKFETWERSFDEVIGSMIGYSNIAKLAILDFEFIEDAGDFVASLTSKESTSSEVLSWLLKNEFCVFHGTRLLPSELASINTAGLLPLVASKRQDRLTEIFRCHENWETLKENLIEVLNAVGPQGKQGVREHQVHFSLSRSGLVSAFNHYLTHGSEFDQRVAQTLFQDDSGLQLLQSKTVPYLVHVRMSGEDLVKSAHPYFSYKDVSDGGEIPGLGATFLNAWAFKKSKPSFDIVKLHTDCCMMLREATPRERIFEIEELKN